jgi:hypothetical protein
VLAAPAFGEALAERSRPVQLVGSAGLWSGWALGLLGLLLPSAATLTAVRMLAPAAPLAVLWAALAGGPSAAQTALAVGCATVAVLAAFTGEFGRQFVQASAYGDESRFPLRPPGQLLVGPLQAMWLIAAVPAMGGPMLLAARSWVLGTVLTLFGAWFSWLLGRRVHQLTRRWLVFVPAGVVIHDQVVLAETSMFPFSAVLGCGLAAAGTEAADLTGTAPGNALEFRLATAGDKVILAPSRQRPEGLALHVRSFIISPSRPGTAVAEARRRGLAELS